MAEQPFDGTIWRVVHGTRSPLDGSKGAGRWNLRESEVLYCSLEPDGAMSEIDFHLNRAQPIFPSRLRSWRYELSATFTRVLDLSRPDTLASLGIDMTRYAEMLYSETQKLGEAVGFLGFEAMLVPNARHPSANLVVFPVNTDFASLSETGKVPVDWHAWREKTRFKP